jgi:hypothetical protein
MCCFLPTSRAQAQGGIDLGLPGGATIAAPGDFASRVLAVPDTTGDGVPDYLVGVPTAYNGLGAIVVVAGPLGSGPIAASRAERAITPPPPANGLLLRGLGSAIAQGCDLNFDGRPEVWAICEQSNPVGPPERTVLFFDTVSLRILLRSVGSPPIETVWRNGVMECGAGYLAATTPNTPFSFDPMCATCGGGGGGVNHLQPGQSGPAGIASGPLKGNVASGGAFLTGAGADMSRWYTDTNISLIQYGIVLQVTAEAMALSFVQDYFGVNSDYINAARHAYWQANIAMRASEDVARQVGDLHELGQDNPSVGLTANRDSWIDQYNNAKARAIGAQCQRDGCTQEELNARIGQAFAAGEFIVDPKDRRVPSDLRDWDNDGLPDNKDCDLEPGVNPVFASGLDALGNIRRKADVDGSGVIDEGDVLLVLQAAGTGDVSKDLDADCDVWVSDVSIAASLIEQ